MFGQAWASFEEELLRLDSFPMAVRLLAIIVVPGLEFMPAILLLSRRVAWANVVALSLLFFFTGAVVWQYGVTGQPQCSCLGEWMRYEWIRRYFGEVLPRNGGLAVLAIPGMAWCWRVRPRGRVLAG